MNTMKSANSVLCYNKLTSLSHLSLSVKDFIGKFKEKSILLLK